MVVHENIYQLQRVKVVCTFITEKIIRESLNHKILSTLYD